MKFIIIYIIGFALACVSYSFYIPKDHNTILAIASPLSTVAAMLFGFIIAAQTFYSGAASNTLIANLKTQKAMFNHILDEIKFTGFSLISSCLSLILSMFLPHKDMFEGFDLKLDVFFLNTGFGFLVSALILFSFSWKKFTLIIKES
ncbi:hypothetical protein WNY97_15925 [Pseudoalteromonas fuliginea]|uniref:hypothetical protein n=1 Tax=Pseudoalteromonas TaxID=53246 RepID=UPI000519B75A|nr:hypothetical protein [Pseudoalteromonas sp. Bsw20308]ALQ07608.1 hypothetical protein D172_005675 [Pseudoalteromonas sp. Bsw20308]